jgi:hypothetical protein
MTIRCGPLVLLFFCALAVRAEDETIALLLRDLSSGTVECRCVAAERLGKKGVDAAPAVPELTRAARAFVDFRTEHADELSRYKDGTEDKQLKDANEQYLKLFSLHASAVEALGQIGPTASAALPMLLEELHEELSEAGWDMIETAIKGIAPSSKPVVNELFAVKQLCNLAFAQEFFFDRREKQGLPGAYGPSIGGNDGFLNDSSVHVQAEGVPGKATPIDGYLFRVLALKVTKDGLKVSTAKSGDEMKDGFGLIVYPNTYGPEGKHVYVLVSMRKENDVRIVRKDLGKQIEVGDDWATELDASWGSASRESVFKEVKSAIDKVLPAKDVAPR